jgi:hypothetical protein
MNDTPSPEEHTEFAEWPDADLDIDDEAFAEAIARGREELRVA